MMRLICAFSTTLSIAKPPLARWATVGDLADGSTDEHRLVLLGGDVELDEHLAARLEGAVEQHHQLRHRVPLGRVGVARRVGDGFGPTGEDRVDDPQPGRAQGATGLGDVDDAVGDVGDLRLAGAVRQADVGGDALRFEEALRQRRVLRRHSHTLRELLDPFDIGVAGDRDDDADGVARLLRVPELTEAHDFARRSPRPSRGR